MTLQKFFQGKKILITGHSGFKGAWLSQILKSWGAKVIGISLPPPTTPSLFEALSFQYSLQNYFIDIRDSQKVHEILATESPEIVFHLAAQPLVRDSYDDPLNTISINVLGTSFLLQAIKETNGVKAAVIVTTDKVYENKEWLFPYREVDSLGGYDPYSASKAAADIIANCYSQSFFNPKDYSSKHSTLIATTRAGNVIGGGDWAKDRLVPDIIRSIFVSKEPIVIRSPHAIRPWQHVLEPLLGYLLVARKLYEGEKAAVGAWNFGPESSNFITVEKLVSDAIRIIGSGQLNVVPDHTKHEANILKLDINKAKTLLPWRPILDIESTLKLTFEWYKAYYQDPDSVVSLTEKQIDDFFEKYEQSLN